MTTDEVSAAKKPDKVRVCTPVVLPEGARLEAARTAIEVFPANAPPSSAPEAWQPQRIAVLTQKFWGARANELTVGFVEQTSAAMRDKVLAHANAWGEFARVRFVWTQTSPIIRISFGRGGYWSYLGTDNLSIPANRQTMNLEGFTTRTSESEWRRVVRHEFGHALGCPHEHSRREIIDLLDAEKVIAEFTRTQGWSREDVIDQILVPLEERSIMGSPAADVTSIMSYQFSGRVTKSGQPVPGGNDFSRIDREYFGKVYPKDEQPPAPPPSGEPQIAALVAIDAQGREVRRFK
jgi:hypothetical protein